MKKAFLLLTTTSFLFAGCGGAAAVEALGKLADKACECKGKAECSDAVMADVDAWVKEHGKARGGDQNKAAEHITRMTGCDAKAALRLASAAK